MQFFNNETRIEKDAERQIKVQRAKNKAITALSHLELERLQNEKKLQPEREEITRLQCETDARNRLQKKSRGYKRSAVILALISVLMSVSGISMQKNVFDLLGAFTGEYGVFAISIFILQLVMLGFSFWSYEIQENHFATYNKIKLFQLAIVSVSIYCNYQYMHLLIPQSPIICAVFACAFDVGSIYFSELATVTQYRLYSNDKTSHNATTFEKIRVVLFGGWMDALDARYQERISGRQKPPLTTVKTRNYDYSEIVSKIKNLDANTVISKDTFGLNTYDWKLCRKELENDKLIYCDKKKTYVNKSLAEHVQKIIN